MIRYEFAKFLVQKWFAKLRHDNLNYIIYMGDVHVANVVWRMMIKNRMICRTIYNVELLKSSVEPSELGLSRIFQAVKRMYNKHTKLDSLGNKASMLVYIKLLQCFIPSWCRGQQGIPVKERNALAILKYSIFAHKYHNLLLGCL